MRRAIFSLLSGGLLALMMLSPASPSARAEEAAVPSTFIYFVAPRPGLMQQMTDADKQAIDAHFQRFKDMLRDGSLILAGPTDPPTVGIVIFKAADLAAAQALAEADPAVKAGTFTLKSVEAFSLALERPGPLPRDYVAQPTARVLHKQVVVKGSLDAVWHAWTTSQGFQDFSGAEAHIDLKIGGPFEILWNPDQSSKARGSEGMRILSYLPKQMLSFEWNAPPTFGPLRQQRTWVVVTLKPVGADQVEVTLDHAGWGSGADWDKLYAYFDEAWGFVLDRLGKKFA
jgi:uncharacterized protein YciI/uncharacterized protein YndB with AHSA1/START domain